MPILERGGERGGKRGGIRGESMVETETGESWAVAPNAGVNITAF